MALSEYLKSEPLDLPTLVDATPRRKKSDEGYVVPSFKRGAILVKNGAGDTWRLSWEDEKVKGKDADRRRALPVGHYTVVGYRLLRESDSGEPWHLSATGHKIGGVKVAAGESVEFSIPKTITMEGKLHGQNVNMSITGLKGAGLSIYKAGHRIPIGYQLTGDGDEPLAKGSMTYG